MPNFAMLTKLSPEALTEPNSITGLNREVESRIKKECPEVKWVANYALLGPYDYLDLFEAPDNEAATKVSLIIRSFGHASTETWVATPWERFENLAEELTSDLKAEVFTA